MAEALSNKFDAVADLLQNLTIPGYDDDKLYEQLLQKLKYLSNHDDVFPKSILSNG